MSHSFARRICSNAFIRKSVESSATLVCYKVKRGATYCGIWSPGEKPPSSRLCVEARAENARKRSYTTIFTEKRLLKTKELWSTIFLVLGFFDSLNPRLQAPAFGCAGRMR